MDTWQDEKKAYIDELERIRHEAGWTKKKLCKHIGIPLQTYCYLTTENRGSIELMRKIMKVAGGEVRITGPTIDLRNTKLKEEPKKAGRPKEEQRPRGVVNSFEGW